MKTIERIRECKKWKQAQKNLEEFSKKLELIKQYPIEKFRSAPHYQTYGTS
ncbi:MAG: hypothetical protein Q8O84_03885 [Nanoarchaeota archaeon]|nr:hypothetical protein [Nanoarchaeota archaeon]